MERSFLGPDLRRDRHGRLGTALGLVIAGVVTLGGAILLAVSLLSSVGPPPKAASAVGAAVVTPDGIGVASVDPLITAQRWLIATRTVSYTDPDPLAWTDRAAPLLTGPAARANTRLAAHGTRTGGGWPQLVADRCSVTVSGLAAVIPPEAPRSSDRVAVQVSGTVHTRCTEPHGPRVPPEPVAATLTLTRGGIDSNSPDNTGNNTGGDQLWRVHEHLR
ncbi:hypothetical protein [Pseudonocardia sp. ICBG601]|uniref:hypothetical protein n=1 Tax=Pseudonocardia sp. ICBG601 TaxID=2846759 RepID=UPI001CF68560|nr:hypothetical protein [Pseudonocardia sp. ICBG601]